MAKKLMELASALALEDADASSEQPAAPAAGEPVSKEQTEQFGEGWKEALFGLVENGPMDEADLPGKDSLKSLAEAGCLTRVFVSDGTFKYGVTEFGTKLYCQVVGEKDLEAAIAKRKEWMNKDAKQAEEAVRLAETKAEDEAEDAVNTAEKAKELGEIKKDAEGNETVAMEGFMDVVKSMFGNKTKVSDTDITKATWNPTARTKVVEAIKKTLIDPKWVAKNIKTAPVALSVTQQVNLSPDGKLHKPVEALKISLGQMNAFNSKLNAAELQAYDKALEEGEKKIEAFYKKNGSNGLEEFAESVVKSIKVPTEPQVDWTRRTKIREALTKAKVAIPVLSIEEVVEGGKAVLSAIAECEKVRQHPALDIYPGVGMDTQSFWEDEEVGENLRVGDVGDFFYFQGVPQDVWDRARSALSFFDDTVTSSLVWLTKATGLLNEKDIATESSHISTEGILDGIKKIFSGSGIKVTKESVNNGELAKALKETYLNDEWLGEQPFKSKKVIIRKGGYTFANDSSDFGYSHLRKELDDFYNKAKSKIAEATKVLGVYENAIRSGDIVTNSQKYHYQLDDEENEFVIYDLDYPRKINQQYSSLNRDRAKKAAEILLKFLEETPPDTSILRKGVDALDKIWTGRGALLEKLDKLVAEHEDDEYLEIIYGDLLQLHSEYEVDLKEGFLDNFFVWEREKFAIDLVNYLNESAK